MHINYGGDHDNHCLPMLMSRVPTTSCGGAPLATAGSWQDASRSTATASASALPGTLSMTATRHVA